MNWFNKGFKGVEDHVKQNEEQRAGTRVRRLWIPQNSERNVIYLDDEGFSFDEHQYEHAGRYDNFLTCPGKAHGCPLCASQKRPYYVTVFSVIDLSEWTDKQGSLHKNEKKVHALKAESAQALKRKKERWPGGLKGKGVVISRKGAKDASSGSDFEMMLSDKGTPVVYKLDPVGDPDHKAFDYEQIFKPKTGAEMRAILGMSEQDNALSAGVPLPSSSVSAPQRSRGNFAPVEESAVSPTADYESDVPF